MKTQILTAAVLTCFSMSAALAETVVEDADGDGSYSMEELAAAYPGLSEDRFVMIDLDENGLISAEEFAAAKEAGILAE